MLATNSYDISETDWVRLGTRPRLDVVRYRKAPVVTTVATMNSEELVKEKSSPPISIGINLEI